MGTSGSISLPYAGPQEVRYLFVDAGCLHAISKDVAKKFFNGEDVDISFRKLKGDFTKVFYYDCILPKTAKETKDDYQVRIAPQQERLRAIHMTDGYHVFEGSARFRKKAVEQKQIDIRIAVDMLTHSFLRNMHKATLLTSDLDFKPLLDALVQNGMYVTLWYQHGHTNKELIFSADSQKPITVLDIYDWATETFRAKHNLPQTLPRWGKKTKEFSKVRDLPNSSGRDIELYQKAELYRVIFMDDLDSGQHIHVDFTDCQVLLTYLENVYPNLGLTSK